jgi:hypothetical protein
MTGLGPGLLAVFEPVTAYRPRHPQATALFRLLEQLYERVSLLWEERFEPRYGPWRGFYDQAIARYLDCGILERGFVRVYCDACRHDFVVAFSCKGRGLCPSCAAMRGAKLAEFLEQKVLEPVDHVQWVFTIPKMVRPYFLYHRELLGDLARAAYETVAELMSAAVADSRGVRPGFVAVVQTFNSDLRFNPHIHAIASRGGWNEQHDWIPLADLDARKITLMFRDKVIAFLRDRDLVDDDRVALLLSWHENTGFSVDNSVRVAAGDTPGLARLARYLTRSPVSLERLSWDEAAAEIVYVARSSQAHDGSAAPVEQRFDPLEFIARLVLHIAEPKRHQVRYFGAYAAVVRARTRDLAERRPRPTPTPPPAPPSDLPAQVPAEQPPRVKQRRRRWAELIRRVYETDPLTCARCGAPMRIIAFILDARAIRRILGHLDAKGRDRAP